MCILPYSLLRKKELNENVCAPTYKRERALIYSKRDE